MDFVETIGRCFAGRNRHGVIDERWTELKKSVLYCIVLHCIALHCIALHCIALCCVVLYCIVLLRLPLQHKAGMNGGPDKK